MSDRQKEEKRQRNLEYAKKFKKKKKKKPSGGGNPFILMAPSGGPYPATCARCKQQTEVPFRPTGLKPVYCDACFAMVRSGAFVPPAPGSEPAPVS